MRKQVSSSYLTAASPLRFSKKKQSLEFSMHRFALLSLLSLNACVLFESGNIESSCTELGTCNGVSDGGIVYLEVDTSAPTGAWKVHLLDAEGTPLQRPAWSGQGQNAKTVVYHESSDTVYLSVAKEVRLLKSDAITKVSGFPAVLDAIPSEKGMYLMGIPGIWSFEGEEVFGPSYDPNNPMEPDNQALRRLLRPRDSGAFDAAGMLNTSPLSFVDLTIDQESIRVEDSLDDVDDNFTRAHDAFTLEDNFGTCSETGATFLAENLVEGDNTWDRYPSMVFNDIVSCEFEPETNEIILFSRTGGVAWMDERGGIEPLRVIKPSEGYEIVHGTVW